MRIDVEKILFVGLAEQRETFFAQAQQAGIIEFISIGPKPSVAFPANVQQFISALKVLRTLPVLDQDESKPLSESGKIAQEIIALRHEEEQLYEEQRLLNLEIERIQPFGRFDLQKLHQLAQETNRVIQFFCVKRGDEPRSDADELILIASEHGLDYLLSIERQPIAPEGMIEMQIDQSLGDLWTRQQQVSQRLTALEHQLKGYAAYFTLLHKGWVDTLNHFHLTEAKGLTKAAMDQSLFAVEGWVPNSKRDQLQSLLQQFHIYSEPVAIEAQDRIPTHLENQGAARLGEDLIHIYDTPSITDRDPSMWVLVAFALFFSVIVGDGGYGFVFLGLSLYFGYKYRNAQGAGKRAIKLFQILAVSCIAWGLLTNTFFAMGLDIEHPLRKVSLLNWLAEKRVEYHVEHQDQVYQDWVAQYPAIAGVSDPHQILKEASVTGETGISYPLLDKLYDNFFMEIALLIGCVHIGLSFLRYLNRNWQNLGWLIFLVGAYLYFPHYLGATSMIHFLLGIDSQVGAQVGLYMIFGGIALAVLIAVIKNKVMGLLEVMTVIQIFADVLSYLRLYALGLAGSIVSATINNAASKITLVAAIALVIFGHTINIALSLMGGVIHGLRLNFIEWYHYSFEGGGKPFNPLRLWKIE